MKRIVSLLLSILMLLSVSACGVADFFGTDIEKNRLLSRTDYFPKRDFSSPPPFSELKYERYDKKRMAPLLDKMHELCEGDYPEDIFETSLINLLDEFGYAYTQQILLELRYDMDISDTGTTDDLIYMEQTLFELRGEYGKALRELAKSKNSELMRSVFSDEEIADFAVYREPDKGELEINLESDKKTQLYDELISAEKPDFEKITEVFAELVRLNKSALKFSDYKSFAEKSYSEDFLRNYSPGDAKALWGYVKKYFAPIISEYENDYYSASGKLFYAARPRSAKDPLSAIRTVAEGTSSELAAAYDFLLDKGLYDIRISDKKAALSYTISLYNYGEPFIFHCADGTLNDNFTLMHEFGHFVNAAFQKYEYYETSEDIDAAELQAHSMEFLSTLYYDEIFGKLAPVALRYLILDMVMSVADGAMYDEFLQRIYEEENLTSEKIKAVFKEIYLDYGYSSHPGYEYEWCYIQHLFKMPFYYVSYCVSALGALQVYDELLKDPRKGAETVMNLLAADNNEVDFESLMEDAGLQSVFSEESCEDIARTVQYTLKSLVSDS